MKRRALLTTAGTTLFAGCAGVLGSDDEYPTEKIEDATIADFEQALSDNGIDVAGTQDLLGDLSLMYFRGDDPQQQMETIALTFVAYRGLVDSILAFTALKNEDTRHGVGQINKSMAADYAAGDLSKDEYLTEATTSYGTV